MDENDNEDSRRFRRVYDAIKQGEETIERSIVSMVREHLVTGVVEMVTSYLFPRIETNDPILHEWITPLLIGAQLEAPHPNRSGQIDRISFEMKSCKHDARRLHWHIVNNKKSYHIDRIGWTEMYPIDRQRWDLIEEDVLHLYGASSEGVKAHLTVPCDTTMDWVELEIESFFRSSDWTFTFT